MMTSHDSDRHPRPPDGGTPAAGGAPRPAAPGDDPAAEALLRELEGLKEPDGPQSLARPTPASVSEVQAPGEGAHRPDPEEVPGYALTRPELLVLARHWARQELDGALFWFSTGQESRADRYRSAYAGHRLGRIAEALGPEAVRGVVADVEEEARQRMGDEHWRAFTEGTDEGLQGVWEQTT
jgi:hypothetical protein